jgi:hypothetical protein
MARAAAAGKPDVSDEDDSGGATATGSGESGGGAGAAEHTENASDTASAADADADGAGPADPSPAESSADAEGVALTESENDSRVKVRKTFPVVSCRVVARVGGVVGSCRAIGGVVTGWHPLAHRASPPWSTAFIARRTTLSTGHGRTWAQGSSNTPLAWAALASI